MDIKICEEYFLTEKTNTKNTLVLVDKEQVEHNNNISKSYYRLYNNLLGYVTNFNVTWDSIKGFVVGDIEFGSKEQAIIFEIINNNHIILNEFIKIAPNSVESDEPLLWKEEVENTFMSASQLEDIISLLK